MSEARMPSPLNAAVAVVKSTLLLGSTAAPAPTISRAATINASSDRAGAVRGSAPERARSGRGESQPDDSSRSARAGSCALRLGAADLFTASRFGASPSGKAADFDSAMRRFESSRPSQPSEKVRCMRRWLPPVLASLVAPVLGGAAPVAWPDSFLSRVEALALLETLNADLLSHPSATLTLERWCGAHHLAPEARIVARLVRGAESRSRPRTAKRLAVSNSEPVRYRRGHGSVASGCSRRLTIGTCRAGAPKR